MPNGSVQRLSRGIALIDSGKWKQRDTWVHFPSSWIRQILERFASGETSLLEESGARVGDAVSQERSDIKIGARECVMNPVGCCGMSSAAARLHSS